MWSGGIFPLVSGRRAWLGHSRDLGVALPVNVNILTRHERRWFIAARPALLPPAELAVPAATLKE